MNKIHQSILTTCIFLPSLLNAQRNFGTIGANPTTPAVRDRITEAALIKTFYEKPRIYESFRNGIQSKPEAEQEYFEWDMSERESRIHRVIPSAGGVVDVGGVFREGAILAKETRERDDENMILKQMAENPDEVERVAREVRVKMTNSYPADDPFKKLYDKAYNHEGSNRLPRPGNEKSLRQQYPEITELVAGGMSPEDAEKFCKGNMTKEEFKKKKKMSEKELSDYINKKMVKLPDASSVPKKQPNQLKLEVEMANHRSAMSDARANLYCGVSIIGLFDPGAADLMSKAGEGTLKMFDGLSVMSLNGGFDPTNLGNVASGLGMVLSIFGGGNSTAMALQTIIENQRKMLVLLQEIDKKVTELQVSVAYLLQLSNYRHEQIMSELGSIQDNLRKLSQSMLESRDVSRILAQQKEIRDFQIRKDALVNIFHQNPGTLEFDERWDAIADSRSITPRTRNFFDDVEKTLSELAVFATKTIQNPDDIAFNDKIILERLSIEDIKAKEAMDINQRLGHLPGISHWLGNHLAKFTSRKSLITYESDSANKQLDGTTLNIEIGNIAIFTRILDQYLELTGYRPLKHIDRATVSPDPNIKEFCKILINIDNALYQMRLHVPLAISILNYYFREIKDLHDRFILQMAQREKLYYKDGQIELIYFIGSSREHIENKILAWDEDKFSEFGQQTNMLFQEPLIVYRDITVTRGNMHDKGGSGQTEHVTGRDVYTSQFLHLTPQMEVTHHQKLEKYHNKQKSEWYKPDWTPRAATSVYETDPGHEKRKPYAKIMASEIFQRFEKISKEWESSLKDQESSAFYLLTNVYRAYYALNTLVTGGYGDLYRYSSNIDTISKQVKNAKKIIEFIETGWLKARLVLELSHIPQYEHVSQKHFDLIFNDAKFLPEKDSTGTTIGIRSVVKDFGISPYISDEFIIDIGNLDNARQNLLIASIYEDIAPPKDCPPIKKKEIPKPKKADKNVKLQLKKN